MKLKLAALALLATTGWAAAADMGAPVPYTKAVAVAPGYNWSGFYIGGMGGFGWLRNSGSDFNGGFAGATLGANWQMSNIVLGVEAEGAWADIGRTTTTGPIGASANIRAFGSVTGRLGLAVDNFLIYGKGGFAAASNRIGVTVLGVTATDTQTHTGYTAGGGVEYGFAPNWSAKAEYLFAHYNSENYFANIVPPTGVASGSFDVHTVKAGINYRFGWGGPVVAKY
ncbi:MAG: outer rane immunogenic protein [Bradyrhizobium sp.]|jgi:outer membrane immunogenic protein|nr:outer rane immunogenic protein [Bradyrhizobium sp.]